MVKRSTPPLDDIFAKTTPAAVAEIEVPAEGRTRAISVGLKDSEIELLETIAAQLGVARNAILRWALRWFLKHYLAGEIDLQDHLVTPEPKKRLEMP